MPLHSIGHARSQSQSHSANAPVPEQSLASLVQAASQTLTGVGNPVALVGGGGAATNTSASRQTNNLSSGLRLQTANTGFEPSSQQNSGVTPIHSGGSSVISPDSTHPPKKSISFRLPSPVAQSGSSGSSRPPPPQQQQQRLSQQEQLYQDHSSSATQSHPHHLSQRPSDPIQKQQILNQQPTSQQTYTAYHSANPSSNTGSRVHISSTTTVPATVPQASQQRSSMHRTNTSGGGGGGSGGSGYSPNAQLAPGGGGGDVGGSRKYNHPGALTPTYPSSSQHTTSHSHSGVGGQGTGLTGSSSSNSMREPQESYGAVGPGRWMCPYGLYAIDWCKWNPSASGGYGRVAVGSYTEDSHNYVGSPLFRADLLIVADLETFRFKSSTPVPGPPIPSNPEHLRSNSRSLPKQHTRTR